MCIPFRWWVPTDLRQPQSRRSVGLWAGWTRTTTAPRLCAVPVPLRYAWRTCPRRRGLPATARVVLADQALVAPFTPSELTPGMTPSTLHLDASPFGNRRADTAPELGASSPYSSERVLTISETVMNSPEALSAKAFTMCAPTSRRVPENGARGAPVAVLRPPSPRPWMTFTAACATGVSSGASPRVSASSSVQPMYSAAWLYAASVEGSS